MRLGLIDACTQLVRKLRVFSRQPNSFADTPYEQVKEAQDWWKTVDLPEDEKEAVARKNAIRVFKLPLEE